MPRASDFLGDIEIGDKVKWVDIAEDDSEFEIGTVQDIQVIVQFPSGSIYTGSLEFFKENLIKCPVPLT